VGKRRGVLVGIHIVKINIFPRFKYPKNIDFQGRKYHNKTKTPISSSLFNGIDLKGRV